jgi:hypothetical protein
MRAIVLILFAWCAGCGLSVAETPAAKAKGEEKGEAKNKDKASVSGKLSGANQGKISMWVIPEQRLDDEVKRSLMEMIGRLEKKEPDERYSKDEKFATADYAVFSSLGEGRSVMCMRDSVIIGSDAGMKDYRSDELYVRVKKWIEEGKITAELREVPYLDGTVPPPPRE